MNLKFDKGVTKDLKKIHKQIAQKIVNEIATTLLGDPNQGKQLKGALSLFMSYRIGDYRVLYQVEGGTLIVRRISHRKNVYR